MKITMNKQTMKEKINSIAIQVIEDKLPACLEEIIDKCYDLMEEDGLWAEEETADYDILEHYKNQEY